MTPPNKLGGEGKRMKIQLDILKGNQGLLIDLDDTNLTNKRHNGIMNIVESFEIDVELIEKTIKEFKARHKTKQNKMNYIEKMRRA